jgi:hypothetical protein
MSFETIKDKAFHGIGATPEQTLVLVEEIENLERRLYPGQGHSYDNEVERQRAVIEQLTRMANDYKMAAEAEANLADEMLAKAAIFRGALKRIAEGYLGPGTVKDFARSILGEQ